MGVNNPGETFVAYDGLDLTATTLANQAKKLEEDLEAIQQKVASVSSLWEGEAHTTYAEQQAAWDREAKGIHQALVAIARVVHSAGGDYMGGDKKAASYYL
ncbi:MULTISPECIES: WXG100 family type VII secretion target [Streptomyces]|uniref:ESAT-6-like protein n=1 Tax=Streptomyces dengpaensis TaxID=2049881 RepID=A0ABN5I066_9ACTN|nr:MULTISPECIES: WXG100 family type VII secretion target [Streptomyces]AVH56168.1 WXG100 family type VII secretion target [Streptomyces dengpaensis]PIB07126.1 WXG100 family type VII secretion target [Streptomyces sp. HG99]